MNEAVLVIGAGPAGLASAYFLQQAGIPYQVIDGAEVVGSTWANLYPSLRLNTTRFFSHLPGMRFPLHWGIFPTGRQYHSHLVAFARRHKLNIRLGVEVYRVAQESELWRVESSDGTACYPCVILAAGRFAHPQQPQIPGLEHFQGEVLHAHDFHDPTPYRDKCVLVVGNGPTGTDIAMAIGAIGQYAPLMSVRTGLDLRPRYPYGLPKHLWMMIAERLPKSWGDWLLQKVEAARYHGLDALGLKPNAAGAVSTVRGPEIMHAIRRGEVKVVDAPLCFGRDDVQIVDGARYKIEVVILATGYAPSLYKFTQIEVQKDPNGWPLRDLSVHPDGREVLGYPGLYLVGVFYKGKGALYNCNAEAQIAVEQIRERLNRMGLARVF
jgi:hypothetical protein